MTINEIKQGEVISNKNVLLRMKSREPVLAEAVYSLFLAGLIHLPKLAKYLPKNMPPTMLLYHLVREKEASLLASAFTFLIKNIREWNIKPIKPFVITITVSHEPIDPRNTRSVIEKKVVEDIEDTIKNSLLAIESIEPIHKHIYTIDLKDIKPKINIFVAPSFTTKEIIIEFSDGIETHHITIPLKDPMWKLNDFPEKITNEIKTVIINPVVEMKTYAPRGVIIVGPPGVGKSTLAEAIALELGTKIVRLTPSTYRSMWYGATERILTSIFSRLRNRRDITIIIDDAEFLTGRHIALHEISIAEISILLNALQDPLRPFTILTSNAPELIDQALLRPGRIDVVILVGYPDKVTRYKIVDVLLRKYKLGVPQEIVEEIVRRTKWFSHAEIDALIRLSASRSKENTIDIDALDWAFKKFSINEGERKRIQDYLRWYVQKLQGIILSFISSESEI